MNLKQIFAIFFHLYVNSRESKGGTNEIFLFVLKVEGRRRTAASEPGQQRQQEKPEAGRGLSIRSACREQGTQHSNKPLCSSCSLLYPPCDWEPQDLVVVAAVEEELVPASSSSVDQPVS